MTSFLVMTVLGTDRPGLVRSLADLVADQGGNWLESRMARLAGQFAGIVRIECETVRVDELLAGLEGLKAEGLTVTAVCEAPAEIAEKKTVTLEVMAQDRTGIVRELSGAIASAGGNVEELVTCIESAPMSGEQMFRAQVLVSLADDTQSADLIAAIENLGSDLTVDVA